MAATFASLGLGQLTAAEKLDLLGELWDDLVAAGPPAGLATDAVRAELRRRAADAVANPNDWVAWEDAREATLRRLGS